MRNGNLRGLEEQARQKKQLETQLGLERERAERAQRESQMRQGDLETRQKQIEKMKSEISHKADKLSKNEQKIQELELKLEFQKSERKQQREGFGQEREAWQRERRALQDQSSQMRDQFQKLEGQLSEQSNQLGSLQRERDNHSKIIEQLKIEKQGFIGRLTRENPLLEPVGGEHPRAEPEHHTRTRVPAPGADPAVSTQRGTHSGQDQLAGAGRGAPERSAHGSRRAGRTEKTTDEQARASVRERVPQSEPRFEAEPVPDPAHDSSERSRSAGVGAGGGAESVAEPQAAAKCDAAASHFDDAELGQFSVEDSLRGAVQKGDPRRQLGSASEHGRVERERLDAETKQSLFGNNHTKNGAAEGLPSRKEPLLQGYQRTKPGPAAKVYGPQPAKQPKRGHDQEAVGRADAGQEAPPVAQLTAIN